MLSLTKVVDRVYCLRVNNKFDLAMLCLRCSEFTETPNPMIRGTSFTVASYMAWYAKTQSETGTFSYPQDWAGFNLKLDDIKKVYEADIKDINHYDQMMMGVYGMILSEETRQSYLIVVPPSKNKKDDKLLEHELTHAMYYIDNAYHMACFDELAKLSQELLTALTKALVDGGYGQQVVDDEIQAYVTTGEAGFFDDIDASLAGEMNEFRRSMIALHDKHYAQMYGAPIKRKQKIKKGRQPLASNPEESPGSTGQDAG